MKIPAENRPSVNILPFLSNNGTMVKKTAAAAILKIKLMYIFGTNASRI
jgi:hypothetical protein